MSSSALDPSTPQEGERLDGRYLLGERLGRGGTGAVRRAHDRVLDRHVAVKLLHPGAPSSSQRGRLREEARLAGALQHPGIARIFDVVETGGDGRQPYLVMELVEGEPLSGVLERHGTLSAAQTLDVIGQVAVSLQVAHAAGIVHRDLKPGNVMLTDRGRVVLVDFGIARSAEGRNLTVSGAVVGTADYISPEQARGLPAGERSDLYALGVVAYQCLTGLRPFRRDSIVATALAHVHDPLPPLPDDVPPRLARLVHALAAKDPESRPQDAPAVVAEVAACAREAMPSVATAAAGAGLAGALAEPPPRGAPAGVRGVLGRVGHARPHRWAFAGLAGALLALTLGTQLGGPGGETTPEASAGEAAPGSGAGEGGSFLLRVPRERLIGRSYGRAEEVLAGLGLEAARKLAGDAASDGAEPGTVVEVEAAERVPAGGTVTLLVAE